MALIATITPARQVTNVDPVTASDLNVGFSPTCALSGSLDMASQAAFGAVNFGQIDISAGATAVNIWQGVTAKVMRVFSIEIIRLSGITAGVAVRLVIRTTAVVPTVIAYALISDIAANIMLPGSLIVYTLTAIGTALASGSGIEVVVGDATNAPINGTTGIIVVSVTALYA